MSESVLLWKPRSFRPTDVLYELDGDAADEYEAESA